MKESSISLFNRFRKSKSTSFFLLWISFFLITIVVRLPHLLSRNFWFDGDEAMVGIMAQDLLAGERFPIYFYGQAYGFSLVEVLSVAFWIKLIGVSIWTLRLAGLTLFSLGIVFIYKGLLIRNVSKKTAVFVALAVAVFPTWMLWGGMVRGGYVTGFCTIAMLYYLYGNIKFNFPFYIISAVLLAIAYESHVFLLLPVLPLLLMKWMEKQGKWTVLGLVLSISAGLVAFFRSLNFYDTFWNRPTMYFEWSEFPDRIGVYVEGLVHAFSNFFYFGTDLEMPAWWELLATIAFVLFIYLVVRTFVSVSKRDKWFYVLSILGSFAVFFVVISIRGYSPRYMISIFTGYLFLILFFFPQIWKKLDVKLVSTLVLALFLVGIGTGSKMGKDWYFTPENCRTEFKLLHDEVVRLDIKAVFVTDNLIQWQWNYLYGKDIPACAFRPEERTNVYTHKVYDLYKRKPDEVGIIGLWGMFLGMDFIPGFNDTRYQVHVKYFVQPDVKKVYFDQGVKDML